jgi:hypothetical protein
VDYLRVTAGGQEHYGGRLKGIELDARCHQVSLHVIDTDEGQLPGEGGGLGEGVSHQQRSHQPGASGGRHRIEIGWVDA